MASVKNQRLVAGFIDGGFGNAETAGCIGQEENAEILNGHLQTSLTIGKQTLAAGTEVGGYNGVKLNGPNAQTVIPYKIMVNLADVPVKRAEQRIILKNLVIEIPRVRV